MKFFCCLVSFSLLLNLTTARAEPIVMEMADASVYIIPEVTEMFGFKVGTMFAGAGTLTIFIAARIQQWREQETRSNYRLASAELKTAIADNSQHPISEGSELVQKVAEVEKHLLEQSKVAFDSWNESMLAVAIISHA